MSGSGSSANQFIRIKDTVLNVNTIKTVTQEYVKEGYKNFVIIVTFQDGNVVTFEYDNYVERDRQFDSICYKIDCVNT